MDIQPMRIGNIDHVTVDMEELPEAIQAILQNYGTEVREIVSEAVSEVGKESRDIIAKKAPVGRRGKYHKSIRTRTEEEALGRSVTIYATDHEYSLTHLLEKGHKLWNSPRRTRAFVHWKTGEQHAIDELPERIVKKLGG